MVLSACEKKSDLNHALEKQKGEEWVHGEGVSSSCNYVGEDSRCWLTNHTQGALSWRQHKSFVVHFVCSSSSDRDKAQTTACMRSKLFPCYKMENFDKSCPGHMLLVGKPSVPACDTKTICSVSVTLGKHEIWLFIFVVWGWGWHCKYTD